MLQHVEKRVGTSVAVLPLHDIRKLQERGQQRAQLLLLRHYLTEELGRCGPRPGVLVERARCYGELSLSSEILCWDCQVMIACVLDYGLALGDIWRP